MDSTVKKKSMMQPKTIAEMLPGLCGIVSRDIISTHTVNSLKEADSPNQSRTTSKCYEPLTLAEMRAELAALNTLSPRRPAQPDSSMKKKMWNSSVKVVNKTESHTSNGQMKHNSPRKPRATIMNTETPTFPRPEFAAKKSLHIQRTVSRDTISSHTINSLKGADALNQSQTTSKSFEPLTLAEMRAELATLKILSPRRPAQPDASMRKKMWNSSVKIVNKTKSHTSDGQMKHNSVRKVLNFQTVAKPQNPRATIMNTETPKFPRPEFAAKKSLHIQNKTNVRISGVYHIPETPVVENKLTKKRFTMQNHFNKENSSYLSNLNKKKVASPKPFRKPVKLPIPDTPLSNMSFKSNSDASFLQKEKEINDIEEKTKALTEEPTLENIAEVSPPVSTPFKEYRNVKEFFNHSNDNSVLCNDTIVSFNKDSENKESSREESVIVSLCDLLNKAKVNTSNTSTELHDLLEVEKQTENNIKMIENGIKTLQSIKESQLKSLQYVKRLINEKTANKSPEHKKDTTLVTVVCENEAVNKDNESPGRTPVLRPSVIKTKSPSYKIPKKNLCLRKKVFHKSMPNVANIHKTPEKNDKALDMYMQMKEKMNFLNTPLVKHRNIQAVDTPTVTSYNLQMQLDKLYNAS